MKDVEKDPLDHLTIRCSHFHVLPADLEVVVVSAGLGQDKDTEACTGQLVGVEGDVVIAPGDHHDGGLQGQLQGGLGQHAQGVQHSGPCKGFKSMKIILSLTNLNQMPHNQGDGVQHWSKADRPEQPFQELLLLGSLQVPMEVGVGVTYQLKGAWQSHSCNSSSSPPGVSVAQVEVDQGDIEGDVDEPEDDIVEDDSGHCPHFVQRIALFTASV